MSVASAEAPGIAETPVVILDSFALISLVCGEVGAARVQQVLSTARREQCRAVISLISLAETAYIVERRRGLPGAQRVLSLVEDLPLEVVGVDRRAALSAAHVKAHHSMALADAFVVALALAEAGMILTGDPEFRSVEKLVPVEWLPA
jgi:predicted nucleic acid-binding protein